MLHNETVSQFFFMIEPTTGLGENWPLAIAILTKFGL
jgi:hypothetical protein